LNHRGPARRNAAYGVEADISQPTISAETVESDPKPTLSSRIDGHARVGGVAIRGGAGSVFGVALGALALLVIQNGLTLVRVDPLWLQGVYGVVILAAVAIDAVVGRRNRAGWRP
jgi:ABC-type xylose transport system permease subunit